MALTEASQVKSDAPRRKREYTEEELLEREERKMVSIIGLVLVVTRLLHSRIAAIIFLKLVFSSAHVFDKALLYYD